MRFSSRMFLLLFALLGCSTGTPPREAAPTPPEPVEVVGADISKYQGQVDFHALGQSGLHYVFAKATQGVDYVDPDFQANFEGARAKGLLVGAYHYYMTNDEPEPQFENFIKTVSLTSGDLPPVVDIEALHQGTLPHMAEKLKKFLDLLEGHYGVKPIIYSGLNFSNEYLQDLGDHPLWLAEYEVENPTLPNGWQRWTFWQYSQTTTVGGIDGAVDGDRFNGDEAALRAILIP